MGIDGKVAVVTGGTGALGSSMVRVLAREGYRVCFTYRTHEDKARALEAENRSPEWPEPRGFQMDVTNGAAVASLAEKIEREEGPVHVLVNNAGTSQVLPFALIEEKDWDALMDVNLKGLFLVTKAFIRGMIRRRRGSVVNIGSLAGMRMLEVPVHYAAAKSAVVGFTLSLAREVGRYGIRVNAAVPGLMEGGVGENVPENLREEYRHFCSLGRLGKPEELAELVAFLASERASYVNGQAIFLDGGI